MNPKNLMFRSVKPVNRITLQDLPTDLVELSEKDLQYVVGGCCCCDSKEKTLLERILDALF